MDKKNIYTMTKDFMKGKWLNFASILILIWFINFVVSVALGNSLLIQTMITTIETADLDGSGDVLLALDRFNRGGLIAALITGFISSLLNSGFMMTLVKTVENDTKMTVKDVFNTSLEYMLPITIISLTLSIIYSFLNLLPGVGALLQLAASFMFIFAEFILADKGTEDGFQALMLSKNMTRGHKMNLFSITINYGIRPYAGLLVTYIGLLVFFVSTVLGAILIALGFILFIGLYFMYIPYVKVATIIYYEEVKKFQQQL